MAANDPTWKSKCTFLNPQQAAHEVEVGGELLKFYPVSVGKLFELRAIARPMAKSLMSLMTDTANDSSVHRGIDEDGNHVESIMAPTPELVEARARQQSKAIDELVETFTCSDNLGIVGGVLIDSLRDLFPAGGDVPPGIEFIQQLPSNLLPIFVKGLIAANKGVLGDFGGKATGLLDTVLGKVKAKADAMSEEEINKKEQEQATT